MKAGRAKQGGIGYGDLQWALTGERLTAETFARYRKQGGMVAMHSIPEEVVRVAMADPMVMIASDGILDNGKGHPRAAGTLRAGAGPLCSRAACADADGRAAQDEPDAGGAVGHQNQRAHCRWARTPISRCSIRSGWSIGRHLRIRRSIRKAFRYVLVNGTLVVKSGELVEGVLPGRAVRR